MKTRLRSRIALVGAVPILLGIALAVDLAWPRTADPQIFAEGSVSKRGQNWAKVSVELPTSETSFPPGDGVEITPQCLVCHSAGMVLRQPPLTLDEWIGEINKMRNAFGAPLPADQVEKLAKYLYSIDGRRSQAGTAIVDGQSN
jgi:hypothetical protein